MGGFVIIEVKAEVDGFLTVTCSLNRVSCFFDNWFAFSSEPRYC